MTYLLSRRKPAVRFLIFFAFIFSSCTAPAPVPTIPPETPTIPVVEPTQTLPPDEPTAIPTLQPQAACEFQQQNQVVRSDTIFDWNRITPFTCYDLSLVLMDESDTRYTGTARVTFTNPTINPLPDLVFRTYANADVIFGGELESPQQK
jgi:hypothetical protein